MTKSGKTALGPQKTRWNMKATWGLHLMLLPGVLLVILFCYVPMAGIVIAFQDYKPWLGFAGSPWVGLAHFRRFFSNPYSLSVIWNTLIIAVMKIIFGLIVPVLFALQLNEIRAERAKKAVQTMVYLPHFLSWVILAGILKDILSVDGGIVNQIIEALGGDPIFFFGDGNWFRVVVIVSDIWKEFGFNTIVYLAALTSVDTALYEAAMIDGCSNMRLLLQIILPLSKPILAVMVIFYGVAHWNDYFNALIYLSDDALKPLALVLRDILITTTESAGGRDNAGAGASQAELARTAESMKYAVIIVSTVPMLCLYPFTQKYFSKGVMLGAIKG